MKVNEYNQMMSYMLRPKKETQVASLMDEYLGDQKEYQKAVDEGFQGTFEEYLRMKSLERKELEVGGRVGFAYGGIKQAMEELIQEGNTTFLNRQKLMDAIEAKTGKRPGGSFQPSQADYKELFKKFTFLAPNIRSAPAALKEYELNQKQLKALVKKVDALNKKYKLGEGKGIKLAIESTQQGRTALRIQTNPNVYGDLFTELEISPRKSAVPNDAGLKDLEKIIKKVTKSKVFKNYDKSAAMKAGGVKSAITQLRNAGSKQDLIFDYVLNSEQTPTIEELSKKFNMSKDLIKKDIKRLYVNMYRRAADEGGVFLPKDNKQLSNVMEKITDMDVDVTKDSVLNLITDAYGDSEEGNALRKKVRKFYKLQRKIEEVNPTYFKYFGSQLDHIIPLNFLTQIRSDIPATDLIRIKPLPGFLNTRAFKAQLDVAIGAAKRASDTKEGKEALKAYSELQTFLPEVLGGISKTGKIKDFGVETLTEDRSLTAVQKNEKKLKKLYEDVFKFIDNPKITPLFEKIGINPETAFQALRGSSQLIRKNIPGFINTLNKILKQNPSLRVEFEDEFSDIENQFAQLNTGTMSDVSPMKISDERFTDADKLLAGTTAAGTAVAARKPLLKTAAKVARPFGFPSVAGGLALSQFVDINPFSEEFGSLKEDPNLGVAGADLLLPELTKQVGIRGLLKNPFFKGARAFTPVGLGLMGIEGIRMGMREQDRINLMRETDPEAYQEYLAEQEDLLGESA